MDYTALTTSAARELGRKLRFIRNARQMTLHDVAVRAGVGPSYVQNIETGARANATEQSFAKIALGYGVPEQVMADLLLQARVMSAFERRGLTNDQRAQLWRGIEALLAGIGIETRTDLTRLLTELLGEGAR